MEDILWVRGQGLQDGFEVLSRAEALYPTPVVGVEKRLRVSVAKGVHRERDLKGPTVYGDRRATIPQFVQAEIRSENVSVSLILKKRHPKEFWNDDSSFDRFWVRGRIVFWEKKGEMDHFCGGFKVSVQKTVNSHCGFPSRIIRETPGSHDLWNRPEIFLYEIRDRLYQESFGGKSRPRYFEYTWGVIPFLSSNCKKVLIVEYNNSATQEMGCPVDDFQILKDFPGA